MCVVCLCHMTSLGCVQLAFAGSIALCVVCKVLSEAQVLKHTQ